MIPTTSMMHGNIPHMGNFAQQIKSQLLTVFMLKSSTDKDADLWTIIFGFMMMFIVEEFFRIIPIVCLEIKQILYKIFQKKKHTFNTITTLSKINRSSIVLEKVLSENIFSVTDAIIEKMIRVSSAQHLIFTCGRFLVNHNDLFEIESEMNVRIKEIIKGGEKDRIEKVIIEVSSYHLDLLELQSRVESIFADYQLQIQNKLGNTIYYFNEVVVPLMVNVDGSLNYSGAKPTLFFNKRPFVTTRTLSNMFGEEIEMIRKRLDFFLNNKEWYVSKGIPYTFGLLLHGEPGCGKTSVIKALSKMTGRHIVNLGFHENLTKTQMEHLFLDPQIYVNNGNAVEQFTIPINKRIYVIEDIDCGENNVVMKRNLVVTPPPPPNTNDIKMTDSFESRKMQIEKKMSLQSQNEKLNLSFLLNLLDGVLETPGRILIMTSNFPEKIDSAFIRPGRVDLSLHFKKCKKTTIIDMFEDYYSKYEPSLENLQDGLFSPAEVNQILFSNFANPEGATVQLLEKQTVTCEEPQMEMI